MCRITHILTIIWAFYVQKVQSVHGEIYLQELYVVQDILIVTLVYTSQDFLDDWKQLHRFFISIFVPAMQYPVAVLIALMPDYGFCRRTATSASQTTFLENLSFFTHWGSRAKISRCLFWEKARAHFGHVLILARVPQCAKNEPFSMTVIKSHNLVQVWGRNQVLVTKMLLSPELFSALWTKKICFSMSLDWGMCPGLAEIVPRP